MNDFAVAGRRAGGARRSLAVALGLVGVMVLSACAGTAQPSEPSSAPTASDEWEAIVEAAKEEGEVVVYHVPALDLLAEHEELWAQTYPEIRLTFVPLLGPDQVARLEAEAASNQPGADVAVNGVFPWIAAKSAEDGFFQPILSPIATSPEGIESGVLSEDALSMAANLNTFGYAWNKRVADTDELSWDELLEGDFSGKLGVGDWCATNSQTRMWYLMSERLGGDEFLEQLAAQDPVFFSNPQLIAQGVVSGELGAGLIVSRGATQKELVYNDDPEGSKEVGFERIPDGVFSSTFNAMILGDARHPNAAQVYVDWLLSPETQAIAAKDTGAALVGEVEGATLDRSEFADIQFSIPEPATFDKTVGADFRKHLSEIFDRPACPAA